MGHRNALNKKKVAGASIVILTRAGFTQDTVEFQLPPRSIKDGKNAEFNSKKVLGRAEPLRAYTGSNERLITFELDYYWYDYKGPGSWYFIEDNLNKLKALTYPQYFGSTSTGFMPAPKVLFTFGRLYKSVPCIVNSVNFDFKDPWVNPDGYPVDDGDVIPFQTTASINLAVSYNYNDARGYEQVRAGIDGYGFSIENILARYGSRVGSMITRIGREFLRGTR